MVFLYAVPLVVVEWAEIGKMLQQEHDGWFASVTELGYWSMM